MATKRGLASSASAQQEVFEAAPAARVAAGPVLRPSDKALLPPASADVVTPALALGAARARFGESPLEWDTLGPSRAGAGGKLERLERLRREAERLLAEEEQEEGQGAEPLPPSALRELRELQQRLQGALEARHAAAPVLPSAVPALGPPAAPAEQLARALEGRATVYEVYAPGGEGGGEGTLGRLAALDARLAEAEAALGAAGGGGGGGGRPVLEELEAVRGAATALGDPVGAERVRRLGEQLRQVSEQQQQQQQPGSGAEGEAVRGLWAAVERWDAVAAALPQTVARLAALRRVHEAAAAAAGQLREMQAEQTALRLLLEQGASLLLSVQRGMAENDAVVAKSIAALTARVEHLSK